MRRTILKLGLLVALALALGFPVAAQTKAKAVDRALDGITPNRPGVRLVIFDPETGIIDALEALRKNRILDIPDLTVIGVYHEKQMGDFADARKFVADNKLDWFKFHVVTAEINEAAVFNKNACTPEFEAIVKKADGVIFFGGPDIPPTVYHKKTSLLSSVEDPYRHYFELSAVFHLLGGSQDNSFKPLLAGRPGFPVLGICLGLQTLNVGTGGTLIQDIWTEVYGKSTVEDAISLGPEQWHTNPYDPHGRLYPLYQTMGGSFHSLELGAESKFCVAMGFKTFDHPRILSWHHQDVGTLGKGLVVVAMSRDGKVIEAIEHREYPNVLGIQFHPEYSLLWDRAAGELRQLHEANFSFREKPGDPLISFSAILAGSPPSLPFNKAIWAWFAAKLKESHGRTSSLKSGPSIM